MNPKEPDFGVPSTHHQGSSYMSRQKNSIFLMENPVLHRRTHNSSQKNSYPNMVLRDENLG